MIWIALLRGINVGGKHMKMKDLQRVCESLGFEDVSTLIQSGNIAFRTDDADPSLVTAKLEAGIQKTFGYESRVILRTREALHQVASEHPYSEAQLAEPAKILVMFLLTQPNEALVEAFPATVPGREQVTVINRELYAFYPDGMGRSKLDTAFIERRLNTTGTGRNWNTILKLVQLADSIGG